MVVVEVLEVVTLSCSLINGKCIPESCIEYLSAYASHSNDLTIRARQGQSSIRSDACCSVPDSGIVFAHHSPEQKTLSELTQRVPGNHLNNLSIHSSACISLCSTRQYTYRSLSRTKTHSELTKSVTGIVVIRMTGVSFRGLTARCKTLEYIYMCSSLSRTKPYSR